MVTGVHAARPASRTGFQRVVISLMALVTVACLLGALGVGYGAWKFDQIHREKLALNEVADGAPANYLVVGSDSRDAVARNDPNNRAFGAAPGERSDTIMVMRIDPHEQKVSVLSLPRDLWVPIVGHRMNERINTAYGLGKQTMVDTVQQAFNIPINHYIEVNFKGFEGLVDTVGGVPMYFDTPMHDPHSGLQINSIGCTVLDGSQALAFARSRDVYYTALNGRTTVDGTGDLGRIARQQHFIKRALAKALRRTSDPSTLNQLVDVGVKNVSIDSGLTVSDLLGLGRRFASFDPNLLQTVALPVTPFTTDGGADVLKMDPVADKPVLDRFREPSAPIKEADVTATVLNGTNHRSQGADVSGALDGAGFHVQRWGEGSEMGLGLIARTQIRYGEGADEAADLLARHLTSGATLVADPALPSGQVVLITGKDFTTVGPAARPAGTAAGSVPATTSPRRGTATTTAPLKVSNPETVAHAVGRVPGDPPLGVTCRG